MRGGGGRGCFDAGSPLGAENGETNAVRQDNVVHTLVVDDDRAIRESLRLALESEGYAVDEAADGRAALDVLRGSLYPMVALVDLRMPRLDGEGLIRAVMADDSLAEHHAFMLITANYHSLSRDMLNMLAQLSAPIVPKPFDLDTLLDTVQELAGRLVFPSDSWPPSAQPAH